MMFDTFYVTVYDYLTKKKSILTFFETK